MTRSSSNRVASQVGSRPSPGANGERRGANGERRARPRTEYHTVATIFAQGPDGLTAYRGWSQDIGGGGARLLCCDRLPSKTLYLRLLLPEMDGRFIEAEVVNEQVSEYGRFRRRQAPKYEYGVRFVRVVSDAELLEALAAVSTLAAPGREATPAAVE
jgi:hypothetical protein